MENPTGQTGLLGFLAYKGEKGALRGFWGFVEGKAGAGETRRRGAKNAPPR